MTDSKSTPWSVFADRLVEVSPDALIALAPNGRVLAWNQGAATIFGYSVEEAVGQFLEALIVPEEHRQEAAQIVASAMETDNVVVEVIRRRKDGSRIHVEVTMRHVSSAGVEPFIAIGEKDVTELRRLRDQRSQRSQVQWR